MLMLRNSELFEDTVIAALKAEEKIKHVMWNVIQKLPLILQEIK